MSKLTTDPNDPNLGRGVDSEKTEQHDTYLVLSKEELDKGFIRPVRQSYVHVGKKIERDDEGRIIGKLIKVDDDNYPYNKYYSQENGYGGFIRYPKDYNSAIVGKYITIEEVEAIIERKSHFGGCGGLTTMSITIAETYARDPKFYGSTYCTGCMKHLPVSEFVWDGTNELVGS